jgi:phosphohistidine phosphatase SixA
LHPGLKAKSIPTAREKTSNKRAAVLSLASIPSANLNTMNEPKIRYPKATRGALCCGLLLALLTALLLPVNARMIDQSPITVILVRHAEKAIVPPENKDPDLSVAGNARAQEIARMFGDSGISTIYATQYKRTQQTVKPLADKLGLKVTPIEAKQTAELVKQIRVAKPGAIIFIAGHNNTVPEIIAALGGPQLPIIPETDFDNLYVLTVMSNGSAKLLKLKYGNALPASGQSMTQPVPGVR